MFVLKTFLFDQNLICKKAPPTLRNVQGACGCKLMEKLRQRPQSPEEIKRICYWLYKGTNLNLLISNSGLCVPLVVNINATEAFHIFLYLQIWMNLFHSVAITTYLHEQNRNIDQTIHCWWEMFLLCWHHLHTCHREDFLAVP